MGKTFRRRDRSWYKNHRPSSQSKPSKPKPTVEKEAPVSDSVAEDITKRRDPELRRNQRGDIIYASRYVGDEKFEYWVEYDNCSRPIAYCDNRGYEWKCLYNSKGNISEYWDNRGYFEHYHYYKDNIIIREDSFGVKIKKRIPRDKFITRESFLKVE